MAKKEIAKKGSNSPVIIQNIEIRQIKRDTQDIDKWRNALRAAESIHNPNRQLLYDLYSDMILDGHLKSIIRKRKIAITNVKLSFTQNGKNNEAIEKIINKPQFRKFLTLILDAKFWGHSLIEFEFQPDKIVPLLVPRKNVIPEKGIAVKQVGDQAGFEYRLPPFNVNVIEVGEKDDFGDLLESAPYVIYKRGGFGDWAQFAELFGMPFRHATYDGYDEKTRILLTQAMQEAGSASYIVTPAGTGIDIKETNSNKTGEVYDVLIKVCNAELSKIILGQTLTTEQGDKGARSLGEVHKEVEEDIHQDDRQYILDVLNNDMLNLLQIHGYISGEGEFSFTEIDDVILKDRIVIDKELSLLIPMDDDYYYETYNVPKPKNYDALKKEFQTQKANASTGADNLPNNPKQAVSPKAFFRNFLSFFHEAPERG